MIDPAANGTGVLYPDGPRYRAIVIDERALPAAVAERLADEAAQGLAVVLVGDLPTPGHEFSRGEDARVQAAVARLIAQPTVARVATQAEAAGALAQLDVVPAAKWSAPTQVYTQHRETADADYFYVYNATNDPVAIDGSFATTGRPYTLNLWTGAVERARGLVGERRPHDGPAAPARARHDRARLPQGRGARRRVTSTSTDPVRETVAGRATWSSCATRPAARATVRFSDGTSSTVTLPSLPAPLSARGVAPARGRQLGRRDDALRPRADRAQGLAAAPAARDGVRLGHLHDHGAAPGELDRA